MSRSILPCVFFVLIACGCVSESQPFTLVHSGTLVYPDDALKNGTTGKVVVVYDVLSNGTVTNVAIVSAEPPGIFEDSALEFVRTWRFRPAYEAGQPIDVKGVESEIRFELESEIPFPLDE